MNNNISNVEELLKGVIHPETGRDIVSMGMVQDIAVRVSDADADAISAVSFKIRLTRPHDPMAGSIRRMAEGVISEAMGVVPTIIVVEAPVATSTSNPKSSSNRSSTGKNTTKATTTGNVGRVIAVASGKGGVGKSTVTANLAVALARTGHRVGVIDADIYGPSMPKMFGLEGYVPMSAEQDGNNIVPAESHGIKIQSIGFFVNPSDALIWRGPMATNALKQLIHQTDWGELDFLLIDLPPGTGDLHLTIVGELKIDGAIIVSTPALVAIADVVRGISMFNNENVRIPLIGIVNNMAYFTPAELPDNKYYIFGQGDLERVAAEQNVEILGEIPLVQSIAHGGSHGEPIAAQDSVTAEMFAQLAERLVLWQGWQKSE